MNPDLTDIVCIIDRSGSMEPVRSDAIGGFNAFLREQKKLPGHATLTLVLFNHDYTLLHDGASIQTVPELNEQTYVPSGTTALLDATGRTIDDVGKRLSNTPEADRPGKVIVAILTDGLENASKDYSRQRVFDMIQHQQDKYSWEFVFLAANQDAIKAAGSIAIRPKDAVAFAASAEGTQKAFRDINARVMASRKR